MPRCPDETPIERLFDEAIAPRYFTARGLLLSVRILRTPNWRFVCTDEPCYVKIAWTLRADPIDEDRSTFHTETRVCTTDAESRRRFRNYWSFVAPGVELIRLAMLRPVKRTAEGRVRAEAACGG